MGYSLMYKVSTGETALSFSPASTVGAGVTMAFAIRGAMSTAPIADIATLSSGASGDPDPASVTATTADCLAVAVGWLDDDNISAVTAPTSFGRVMSAVTTGADGTAGGSVMVAFQPCQTTGSVTVSSFDTSGTDEWAALSFTIRHD
jgi:hypothetical protein